MFKKISLTIAAMLILTLVAGCSGKKETAKLAKGINVIEIKKVLDTVVPIGSRPEESVATQMADDYAGVGKSVDRSIDKDVFLIYAGLENQYDLKVSKPTAIITAYGNTNNYTVTKTQPFEGDVIFIAYQPQSNKYNGAEMITVDEFRKNY